ncbi:hypothetical protein Tsubulata_008326, partial [Turnera subulata]
MSSQDSFDVKKLASMRNELRILNPLSQRRCIYKVPNRLRKLDEAAYTPQWRSIRGDTCLSFYTAAELAWSLTEFVAEKETELRKCYMETIKFNREDFVKMVKPWLINDVRRDMCLLENQLPFFILADLLELYKKHCYMGEDISMTGLAYGFFNYEWRRWMSHSYSRFMNFQGSGTSHFIVFLKCGQQPLHNTYAKVMGKITIPSVTELHQEGQCHCDGNQRFVNDYITLMNWLVKAPKDVEILAEHGIIVNLLWSNEAAATLIHNLGKESAFSPTFFCFSALVDDLNKYYKKALGTTAISVAGAGILPILTIIQTVCSVVSIGPLHHGQEELKAMEEHKWTCLDDFLRGRALAWSLIEFVAERGTELRKFYTKTIKLNRGFCENGVHGYMREDITMPEPAYEFLNYEWPRSKPYGCMNFQGSGIGHFIEFLRCCQQPLDTTNAIVVRKMTIPSPTELQQAGVKFKPRPSTGIAETSEDHTKMSDQDSLDVKKLADSMRNELQSLHPLSQERCIYRVPNRLRKLDEAAYMPLVVSIGPLHHGQEELKAMEEHKRRYLDDFLRAGNISMEILIEFVAERETELRKCYMETIKLNREDFVKMVVLDATFIIVLLRNHHFIYSPESLSHEEEYVMTSAKRATQERAPQGRGMDFNDHIFDKPWLINDVRRDMCLLENQLPFSILADLLELYKKHCHMGEENFMPGLACEFFNYEWPRWMPYSYGRFMNFHVSSIAHFVNFLRCCQKPLDTTYAKVMGKITIPSVTELHQAGVKFKLSQSTGVFDIKFRGGILEIPRLTIKESKEVMLRNILAFEQCHCHGNQRFVNDYITLMNWLVKAPKDMEILAEHEIIVNLLWSNEAAATLIHNLGKESAFSPTFFCFSALFHKIAGTSEDHTKMSDQDSLDVKKLADSMRNELQSLHPLSPQRCIYRVPDRLRKIDEAAYTPRVVSIGPLHHGQEELKAMEEHKWRYLDDFLRVRDISMESLIEFVAERVTELRKYYMETIKLNREDFVKMVVLDATFIIVLLRNHHFIYSSESLSPKSRMVASAQRATQRNMIASGIRAQEKGKELNDHIFDKPWLISDVRRDMCLLENQLPFFILADLLEVYKMHGNMRENITMMGLAYEFFNYEWPRWMSYGCMNFQDSGIGHFIDFLRCCQQPPDTTNAIVMRKITIPSVTELHQAGVKFKLSLSTGVFNIKFRGGIQEIPRLTIKESKQVLFRNILAFEQCHCIGNQRFVNDYITLMNWLIKAPKDVEILAEHGIIVNLLWSNEAAATLIHNLGKESAFSPTIFCFSALVDLLNEYCKRPWHKWKATLKQVYFNSPWAAFSVAGAVILLILTIIQTVCSVIQIA